MTKVRTDATRETERRWRETHRHTPAYKAKKARKKARETKRYAEDAIYRERVREQDRKYRRASQARTQVFVVVIATTEWREVDGVLVRYHGDLSQLTKGASVDA